MFGKRDWIRVPDEATVKALHSQFWDGQPEQQFCYVKLHGSYGWRSADDSNAMVIGGEKESELVQSRYSVPTSLFLRMS